MNENPPTVRLPDLQIRFDRIRRGEPLDDTLGRGRALLTRPPTESDEDGTCPVSTQLVEAPEVTTPPCEPSRRE
jgi:hypothetical protein